MIREDHYHGPLHSTFFMTLLSHSLTGYFKDVDYKGKTVCNLLSLSLSTFEL